VLELRSKYRCSEFIISNWNEKFYINAQNNNFYLIAWIHLIENNEEDKLMPPDF